MPAITFQTSGALRKSTLRRANGRLVLNAIRTNPGTSRADIARLTGLSPSSVTFVVNRLMKDGWLSEKKAETHSQVGRRPTALHLRDDARVIVGVEISPWSPQVVLADLNGRILRRRRMPWRRNPALFLEKVRSVIETLTKPFPPGKVLGVGVSLVGDVDPATGRVIAAENLDWAEVEAGRILQRDLGFFFCFENDANLMAFGEKWFAPRHDRPLQHLVGVTMQGGIGTGVIINGRILHGASWSGGEFGHTMLYADGRACACGNQGCWEQYASEKALCQLYYEKDGAGNTALCSADQILGKARDGDPVALDAVRETARNVGLGLVNVIWALNPEAIVLGDYVARGWALMEEPIWDVVRRRVAPYNLAGLEISPSKLGADATVLGAVALVLARFFTGFEQNEPAGNPNSVSLRAPA